MKITYPEYIKNPMQNRIMSNRDMYYNMYRSKLDALLVRENNEIPFYLFKDNDKRYIALIKVPSETVKHFFYDVAIEFYTDEGKIVSENDLKNYNVRFYSNDPSFVFNFCYSFMKNDIFFMDLESKMSKLARTQKAVVTNAKNEVGYCKSIFFAYLIMESRGLFNKSAFSSQGRKYDKHILLSMVEHTSVKFSNRKQQEQDQRKVVKEFEKAKKVDEHQVKRSVNTSNITNTKKVGSVAKVKRI